MKKGAFWNLFVARLFLPYLSKFDPSFMPSISSFSNHPHTPCKSFNGVDLERLPLSVDITG